ncbi:hypothetical protein [Candidatus Hydrogenosomobacter endosymbioticus]|uniref:Uncharacterized protein n=1 Tax=Candidatus Hydrogenosomobacter endosymbioticus TaxID=2558174 RepID=A0ABM7V8Y6_9PROT|nr:hypothetical protein [Candidatus Hydrogenosomobacter endosymbioticus]BDB96260.1 hypothetical protein HYD_3930 [Candidatus Hydrogenosomobacter endosymbioticus]
MTLSNIFKFSLIITLASAVGPCAYSRKLSEKELVEVVSDIAGTVKVSSNEGAKILTALLMKNLKEIDSDDEDLYKKITEKISSAISESGTQPRILSRPLIVTYLNATTKIMNFFSDTNNKLALFQASDNSDLFQAEEEKEEE